MKAKTLFYKECHLAGRKYHDADEVWEDLKVGTKLQLVRDLDNHYDPNAVAVVYSKLVDNENEEFLLGYVPKDENKEIALFLEMGWNDVFECRISKLDSEENYDKQMFLTIRIKKNVK